MATLRRLNDATTYYGLSWRGWLATAVGAGVLYGAVRLSPLPFKPTLTITLLILAGVGMVLYGLSGQALGVGRYLTAVAAWRLAPKRYLPPDHKHPVQGGLAVDAVPLTLAELADDEHAWPGVSVGGDLALSDPTRGAP